MSDRFGPNFAPGSFALQQSVALICALRALSRSRNRATRAQRGTTTMHTHRNITRTRQRRQKTTASPRLGRGSGRLLPRRRHRRRCCCCAAAAVLLLYDPRCIAEHNPSQQTVSRFVFFGTHAEASNGTAAAAAATAAGPATGKAKTFCTSIPLDIRRGDDVSTIFLYGLSSPSGGPRCCCDSCEKKGLPCCRRLRRYRRRRRRCCFCCAAAELLLCS